MPEAASFSNNRWRLPTFASQIVGVSICFSRVQELQRLELKESMDTPNGTTKPTSVKIGKILGDIFGSPPHPDTLPEPLDPSNVFLRMGHGAIMIILHRVAKAQASNVDFPSEVVNRSQVHCDEAAAAILRTMKLTSHWNVHIVSFSFRLIKFSDLIASSVPPVYGIQSLRWGFSICRCLVI